MAKKNTYYKKVLKIEIFSDQPINEGQIIDNFIPEHIGIKHLTTVSNTKESCQYSDENTFQQALIARGLEPEYFGIGTKKTPKDVIVIHKYVEVVDNFGTESQTTNKNKIKALLKTPENWDDDIVLYSTEKGGVYTFDDLVGQRVKVLGDSEIFEVKE